MSENEKKELYDLGEICGLKESNFDLYLFLTKVLAREFI